ncbi:hypothetical protein H8M03_05590 [Sphingomonas sabuli]|uniref:Glycosyltransferase family 1 protein n=1 Tax=Sphingomonas sabuli TaxID=2764186 RepID=A0A7G9L594_9SPHN|nr:hypothetical protein [Sphingomonas sabuli]QNM83793.1 hypothetical protein H8M03_05590 [Sphingomonas sabuli]
MKVSVLVPSDEYKGYAGARIRYGRLTKALAQQGLTLALCKIGDFEPASDNSDIIIISKCHDARALVAAALFAARGKLVGVDLFDDYFSQWDDSRLTRFRNWLGQLLEHCAFALCSTDAMAGVVREYRRDVPVHVVHDPAPPIEMAGLQKILRKKLAEARQSRVMRIAWFGVGDNPHFRIGLHDVAAFSGKLRPLRRVGMDIELTVMTNPRSLTVERLAELTTVPVRTKVEEWSEDGEDALLRRSLIAYLPVNLQRFSAAKSLNRAVTALSRGCQVLSAGFPLYDALDELIYRDTDALAADLEADTLRLSPARIDRFEQLMHDFASAETEADRLAHFLHALRPPRPQPSRIALVHGLMTNKRAGEMVEAAEGLTVASPYSPSSIPADVVFRWNGGRLDMLVSGDATQRLRPAFKRRLAPREKLFGRNFLEVPDSGSSARTGDAPRAGGQSLGAQLATYHYALKEMSRRMNDAFGACRMVVSENSPLPFPARI